MDFICFGNDDSVASNGASRVGYPEAPLTLTNFLEIFVCFFFPFPGQPVVPEIGDGPDRSFEEEI